MTTALLLGLTLVAALVATRRLARAGGLADPRVARVIGGGALAAAALLLLARQAGLAMALGAAGAALLAQGAQTKRSRRAGRPRRGSATRARSRLLDMALDHESGEMDGKVLGGRFAGRLLSDMALDDLLALAEDVAAGDPEGERLLEAYLDRAHPDWRTAHARRTAGPGNAGSGPMSRDEAYRVLGLEPGADAEAIAAAYRRLIKRVHPDAGGSAALAAQINAARAALLGA